MKTERYMQRILTIEGALILVALGIDIFIATLETHDWIASIIVLISFFVVGVLYRHVVHIDRSAFNTHTVVHDEPVQALLPTDEHVKSIENTPSSDILLTSVGDRPILHVSNFLLSRNFYVHILRPLGYAITMDFPTLSMVALGIGGQSDLWIRGDEAPQKIRATITAPTKESVDVFYGVALDVGASSVHAPHEKSGDEHVTYMASVADPDGHTIEAVFRE